MLNHRSPFRIGFTLREMRRYSGQLARPLPLGEGKGEGNLTLTPIPSPKGRGASSDLSFELIKPIGIPES
jgi:hypothetical protein